MEVPSSYLVDKALKTKSQVILEASAESVENKHEALSVMVDGLSAIDMPETGGLAVVPLESQSMQERMEMSGDITLTDLEKTVTAKQLKFAWNLAAYRVSGKGSLTKCALDAGYSEGAASKEGSMLARNPVVAQIAKDRMPAEFKLKAVKERGPDYVIERAVTILERSMQEVPVLDKNGSPTGHYVYDASAALKSLDMLANWMGMNKEKVDLKVSGSEDGAPIKVDSRQVQVQVLTIADRIRASRVKKEEKEDKDAE